MNTALQILSGTLILLGSVLALTAAIGIVRFPDTLRRMHSATKPQVVGLVLILSGAIVSLRDNIDIWMMALAILFTLVTAPVIAHTVSRVAYREQRDEDGMAMINELDPDKGIRPPAE
ncbi:monovalent cation/H(+) antiporter subunit G [Rhodococcus triatomae]|uniref:Multicomponent Na+:H+ antiporter subunit G n=1 Tax=Rhodococcus triatomae TaxID=300028 RepID=A0A1G8NCI4_9NOCA|nr:monovalent cation/H(+) antiporter subunit G [Rhodococcus triatomae]QNG19965.1 monovalent cation/H(+) antiporter subunit G [Rhodococcus triatomae]QNG24120.1 monovalent cation/H(+) antiporter subunit G [Rhodococcus triatomae]SDI77796.1 multicomponent Na+:H+ antiporter subunit G [Rhodococcus triatomae]